MVFTALVVASPAGAQSDYPNRPIQLVVPYGAGGVADDRHVHDGGEAFARLRTS